jgi:hypothetical protein
MLRRALRAAVTPLGLLIRHVPCHSHNAYLPPDVGILLGNTARSNCARWTAQIRESRVTKEGFPKTHVRYLNMVASSKASINASSVQISSFQKTSFLVGSNV